MLAVAAQVGQHVFQVHRVPGQHLGHVGLQARPQFRAYLRIRLAHRGRVLVPQQVGIGFVVEQAQFRSPGDGHREVGADDQVGDRLHALGPGIRLEGPRKSAARTGQEGEAAMVAHQDCPVLSARRTVAGTGNLSPRIVVAPPTFCNRAIITSNLARPRPVRFLGNPGPCMGQKTLFVCIEDEISEIAALWRHPTSLALPLFLYINSEAP